MNTAYLAGGTSRRTMPSGIGPPPVTGEPGAGCRESEAAEEMLASVSLVHGHGDPGPALVADRCLEVEHRPVVLSLLGVDRPAGSGIAVYRGRHCVVLL